MSSQATSQVEIVLIEDEPTLVALYSFGLKKLGHLSIASTKQEALIVLGKFITASQKPSVVLLDLILPDASTAAVKYSDRVGFEVLEWIRQQKVFELVPVIVMTNLDSTEDRLMAERLGANGYIVKSNVVPKEIVEEIKAVLA